MKKLIELSLSRRHLVLAMFLVFLVTGFVVFQRLNIEAYADPAPPMVELITQNPGYSAEDMERYITIPLEVALAGMPGLQNTRSISLYGLSDIKLQFSYETDYWFAQQQVLNRINQVQLPNGVQPFLSPTSPVGEIYRYQVKAPPGYSLLELKTLEDWLIERRLRTIPGVVDVIGWGGLTKEYHADIDMKKLVAFNIPLKQVLDQLAAANMNVGARTINLGEQSVNVRGVGLLQTLQEMESVVLSQNKGNPVLLRDVATLSVGNAQRMGIIGRDKDPDIVEGIVLMRRGEKTLDVVNRIEVEVERLNHSGELPPGVRVESYYDRKNLVNQTTHTVLESLLFGICLIFFIQYLFLGDLRTALIVAATIPAALFFSVMLMVLRGDSANLLSVGAIDFGIIVDSTVILVENIYRRLMHPGSFGILRRDTSELLPGTPPNLREKFLRIFASSLEVDKAIFFSAAITIAAFIPLFTMQGVEGQIFAPMAKTYGYAMVGAILATFLVTPMLSSYLLPLPLEEKETFLIRFLNRIYRPALRTNLKHRYLTIAAAAVILVVCGMVSTRIGSEFLPKLEEGNLWIRASLPPTISLEAGVPYVTRMREYLKSQPMVETVISQHGRPDDGTDPTGFFNVEFFAPLASMSDRSRWGNVTKPELIEKLKADMARDFPGVVFNFSQNIEDNVQEAVSGVKGENSIKLFGNDLMVLEQQASAIKDEIGKVQGVQDVGVFHQVGQPNLLIQVDRIRSARYGLQAGEVNSIVQAAIGGQAVTQILEGDRQFDLRVRLSPEYRSDINAIRKIPIPAPSGATVLLSDVANIEMTAGASYIYRENAHRYIPIKFSVRDRDLGGAVSEAQQKVQKAIHLPAGYSIEWSGEFGALQEAKARLMWIIPLSLMLIMVLLYGLFNNLRDSILALWDIPFATCGGILALYITGLNLSVSAAVGFISLFGVSVMNGILVLTYYNQLRDDGMEREMAMTQAAETRMRPLLMTSMSACVGLLPAALSHGIGSQVQRPLATVIVGGMLLGPILILLLVPILRIVSMPKLHRSTASMEME
ncbi:efflux RND transporter permease subunit [Bryobacter aggregatus]|uniref:efflux RND transporter permease subunit n=1 Tax=Bryobacter aggregatus TaxID=360054 RepID=UPI0004E1F77B|nr:CusA/CzcA family heavy metal efflux RND transporter [Bryobacter aggregatus]